MVSPEGLERALAPPEVVNGALAVLFLSFLLFKHRNLVCLVAIDMLILVGLNKLKNDEQVCTVCICEFNKVHVYGLQRTFVDSWDLGLWKP